MRKKQQVRPTREGGGEEGGHASNGTRGADAAPRWALGCPPGGR